MFYLFILESIGTSELILIGLVALIVFGPRKLPELAKTLGKAMNEFRRSTDDFKRTWEQEVNLESEEHSKSISSSIPKSLAETKDITESNKVSTEDAVAAPEIRQLNQFDFEKNFSKKDAHISIKAEATITNKQDWL